MHELSCATWHLSEPSGRLGAVIVEWVSELCLEFVMRTVDPSIEAAYFSLTPQKGRHLRGQFCPLQGPSDQVVLLSRNYPLPYDALWSHDFQSSWRSPQGADVLRHPWLSSRDDR